MESIVVTSDESMRQHAQLFANSYNLQFVSMSDAPLYQNIYQTGIYSKQSLQNIIERKEGRVVLHWCGNDAFDFERKYLKRKYKNDFPPFVKHVAQSDRQVKVLHEKGIEAKVVRRFSDKKENYSPTSLPTDFRVLIYTPIDGRFDKFNYKLLQKIVEACSDIEFLLFGEKDKEPTYGKFRFKVKTFNAVRIKYVSLLDDPDRYRDVLKASSCLLRFKNRSEGFSQMIMQMLLLGRYVLSNIDQEYVEKFSVNDFNSIVERLQQLKKVKEANYEGSDYYHNKIRVNNFDFI